MRGFWGNVQFHRRGGSMSPEPRFVKRLGHFIRAIDRLYLCDVWRHHAKTMYSSGSGGDDAVVRWLCGRCHRGYRWGIRSEGPLGAEHDPPTREMRARYRAQDHERWRLADERLAEELERVVDGECNATWAGGRCDRPAGHAPPHGHDVGPFVIAPWNDPVEATEAID